MTGKLNLGLETTFKIDLDPSQDVHVLYQNKTIMDEYQLTLIGEFNTDEDGKVDYGEVLEFLKEKCNFYLEQNNVLNILMGLEFNISIKKFDSFLIH